MIAEPRKCGADDTGSGRSLTHLAAVPHPASRRRQDGIPEGGNAPSDSLGTADGLPAKGGGGAAGGPRGVYRLQRGTRHLSRWTSFTAFYDADVLCSATSTMGWRMADHRHQ